MRVLWSILLIPIGVYLGFTALLLVFQSSFVYFPERELELTPAAIGLSHEEVRFESADGLKLHGWFVQAENPRGTILYCHGNAGNISHRMESIRIFYGLQMNTFIFDYRGYGQSEGKPSEVGTYRDVEAAWLYLVNSRKLSTEEIVVFGQSLGGPIAAWSAKNNTPRALIIESSFTSIPDVGADVYPFFPIRWISRFKYQTMKYIRQADCPILVVHSVEDELISFKHGKKLFEAAAEPKEFLEIRGGHNDGFFVSGETYIRGLNSFLSKYFRGGD